MSALRSYPTMTVDEYIGLELRSDFRHEYDCGTMDAMSGASDDHMIIVNNISYSLTGQLDDTDCQPFTESMRRTAGAQLLLSRCGCDLWRS